MNKNTLYTGLVYTAVGAALFLIALLGEYAYEALLWGFGGGSLGSGLSLVLMVFILISMAMIAKYDKNGEGTAF